MGPADRKSRFAAAVVPAVLVALAAAGFLATRAAKVELAYNAMNPIRDPVLFGSLAAGTLAPDDAREHLTVGSATAAETLYLPPPIVLAALSLGYRTALADLLFVRAHSYFLSHFFADRVFTWLDDYVGAILALDPDNPRVYLWAALVVKLGQHIDDERIGRANRFLEAGIARFPRDWRLHMELGFNLKFEYVGTNDADRAAARLRARDHFAITAGLPGAPLDPNFVAVIFQNDREDELAVGYALQKYFEASDEQKQRLLDRVGILSEALARGIREEEEQWKADFPFLPVALHSCLGGRPRWSPPLALD